ncbi:hypothetical protein BTVI_131259 [Pitangus sulphuratus]|nr:hypothetical protein BTVI_131259 [Pitangus sulphuratus]
MGLSSSKAHPKVTKVAPMRPTEDLPSLSALHRLPSVPGQPSPHPSDMEKWGKPIFHLELPPLRETWYGRASSGPLFFNTVPEKEGTSIIKQHPPRRPQEELKRNLHREAKASKQKIKEFSPMDILDTLQRSNSNESQGPIPAEHNQHFHEDDHGNTWGGGPSRRHDGAELSPGRRGKVDLWFCREPRTRDLFWDTSSTGSEEWEREEKIHRKPALVRTKTERVSLFDDFFDRDF